jgi:hypothetical protein
MPICKGARLKIKRANKHIADLETCIESLKERLVATAHVDANSGCEYIKCGFAGVEESEVLEDLSGIIGDAVHNLKCALDHVWVETLTRLIPAKNWGKTKFPVFATRDNLEAALRNLKIEVSSPYFFRFIIGQIKPYNEGDWAIRTVHKLDIKDKHQLLIPVIHYSSIGDIYLEDQYGETHQRNTWATAAQLPYYVNVEGMHIKDPGGASFVVMFQNGDVGRETRAPDTLRYYHAHVLMIVKLFEEFTEAWGF